MSRKTVKDFGELHSALEPHLLDKRWIFRGHADAGWPLLPKAGRPPYDQVSDHLVFDSWKRRALEFVSVPPIDDWDWLAIAQHHGLATRLLDWTLNPLNAAFFALREETNAEAAIVAILPKFQKPDSATPVTTARVALVRPRAVVPRIVRQGGVFTIHPDPKAPLNAEHPDLNGFLEIIIPRESRARLLAQLAYYGIHSATLFPDLDGLSAFVNWGVASGEYFRR